jgi:apolipoprotein N-acyltransferase
VVQAAPTGFSAFVTPDGEVLKRSAVSEARVETETISLRDGKTLYVRWGEVPALLASVLALIGAWLLARRAEPLAEPVEDDDESPLLDRTVNEGKGLPAHGH